eukprot:m.180841 g.180841  ORF g.180841 m.180841 type:complete len:117 (+) comp16864_c0_seq8:575-925(+)
MAGSSRLVDQGMVKSIGVSNFGVAHLQELAKTQRIPPAINQIECHPQLYQHELELYCQDHQIAITAYSSLKPLTSLGSLPALDKVLSELAEKHACSKADLLLRYSFHQDLLVDPAY